MEIWRDISGYEGRYQVSNHGRVKTVARHKTDGRFQPERIRKTEYDRQGYEFVNLFKDGKYRRHSVHVLVAQAFIDNPKRKPQVNHKDGDKANNHVSNLEWVTGSENIQHAFITGLFQPACGEDHGLCKVSNSDVKRIREMRNSGMTYYQIADEMGLSFGYVGRIIRGERRLSI